MLPVNRRKAPNNEPISYTYYINLQIMTKRFIYAASVAAILLAGCSSSHSYKVTGTVEGAADGDTVLLQERTANGLAPMDTAIIRNGKFTFTGRQDSAVNRYITYAKGNRQHLNDFFLENSNIQVQLGHPGKVSGTPNNDAYQAFIDQMNQSVKGQRELYAAMQKQGITDEERKGLLEQINEKETERQDILAKCIHDNIQNAVGLHLLSNFNFMLDPEQLAPLLERLPEQHLAKEGIAELVQYVEAVKKTAAGQKFTDFSMQDPEGNTVKLSDFIGKNKCTAIDFWASWCGPCRREIPELAKVYEKYKGKGFGIVGVSLDRDKEDWVNAIKELKMGWAHMSDLKFWECEGAQLYAVRSIPHLVLVAQDGTILERGLHAKELDEKLVELLK